MRNAGLEEAQAAIKIAGRDINNLSAGVQPPQDPGKPEGGTASVIDLERDKEKMLKIRK